VAEETAKAPRRVLEDGPGDEDAQRVLLETLRFICPFYNIRKIPTQWNWDLRCPGQGHLCCVMKGILTTPEDREILAVNDEGDGSDHKDGPRTVTGSVLHVALTSWDG